jgi:transposase
MEPTRQYVGIDLHRRRSVIVRKDGDGQVVDCRRIDNQPLALASALRDVVPDAEIVMEACNGWYWAAEVIAELGGRLHLAHPLGNDWGKRRVKNDERDAEDLADLLRLGRLAEAWVAPRELRELRELVRYRIKLRQLRSGLRCQVHAVFAKEGIAVPMTDLFGRAGADLLDTAPLADAYAIRVESLRDLLEVYDREIALIDRKIAQRLGDHHGYQAIQQIPGVGPVLAAVFVAEIGDIGRFPDAHRLSSWAGLTPRHRESDTKVRRGHITKQGPRLVRWAAVEAVARGRGPNVLLTHWRNVASRRGVKIGRVAAARKLLTLVFYGLRDGEIRCLQADEV